MLKLIKNKTSWKKYLNNSKDIHNLSDFNIAQEKPIYYPCIAEKYLISDVNGIKLKFIFIYKDDFKLFKET